MATISKVGDLIPLLGSVVTADDPIATLEQRGHVLNPALKQRLQPQRGPTPAQLQLWKKTAVKAGAARFTVGQRPQIVPRQLAPNEYEFSAGVRMSAANEALAGMFANGTIPGVLFLDELLSAGNSDTLQKLFRMDKPGGRMGRLQITSPPTIAPLREGGDHVALTIPFRLNFERITKILTGEIRAGVTFATGRIRLSVGLVAEPSRDKNGAANLEIQLDLSGAADARLEIDANSPVQLVNPPAPGQIDLLAAILQNELRQRLAGSLRMTVSAVIPLPIGRLEIRTLVILTRGDALLVGIKVVGTIGLGNPDTLTALFPNAETNFFIRVHDQVLRLIVQSAAKSGVLTQMAKKTHPDAVINSADVAFGKDTIKLIASGKIVDLCPLGVDLGFTVTTTLTITMDGTAIHIKKETSQDLDNTDAFLCAVTSLGLALLAAIAVLVFQGIGLASGLAAGLTFGVVGVLTAILEFNADDFALAFGGSGGDGAPTPIELDFPLPGTDLLPTLTGSFMRLDESTMLIAAHLGTQPDTLNTYFYVRFMEANALGIAQAMRGARVRLMDRDSPPPAGDDVTLPGPTKTQTGHHTPAGNFTITTATSFERTADEMFREDTTDRAGRVRFYVPRDKLASNAGVKVVETTRLLLDTDEETTTTQRTPVPEARPDFYFRVTRPNGSTVDTLQLTPGFFKNFVSTSIGTPTNPLTITFGGGLLNVLDPNIH
jgi:hypothetical protein